MNSLTFNLPIGLFAFRFWMLFAIPVSMLTAEGCLLLTSSQSKSLTTRLMALLLIIHIISTSGYAKYSVNTNIWPAGIFWVSREETLSYAWLRQNLPPDTRVFSFKDNLLVIGQDMRADFWKKEYKKDFHDAFGQNIKSLFENLKKHGFQYLIISPKDTLAFGFDHLNKKIEDLVNDKNFQIIANHKKGARIFKIIY
jgi:hypothetical protein